MYCTLFIQGVHTGVRYIGISYEIIAEKNGGVHFWKAYRCMLLETVGVSNEDGNEGKTEAIRLRCNLGCNFLFIIL